MSVAPAFQTHNDISIEFEIVSPFGAIIFISLA